MLLFCWPISKFLCEEKHHFHLPTPLSVQNVRKQRHKSKHQMQQVTQGILISAEEVAPDKDLIPVGEQATGEWEKAGQRKMVMRKKAESGDKFPAIIKGGRSQGEQWESPA